MGGEDDLHEDVAEPHDVGVLEFLEEGDLPYGRGGNLREEEKNVAINPLIFR